MDHLIVLYTTNFLVEAKNKKQSFIGRSKRKFDANKISLDISSQDWDNLYQCEDGNCMYNVSINVFSTTLDLQSPFLKNFQPQKNLLQNIG